MNIFASADSLAPRPSPPPVFDRLQYILQAVTGGGEGLGTRLSAASYEHLIR